jgi:FkbM family methyltransferase
MIFKEFVCSGLRSARRSCCEIAGISRYSRPALNDLDRKLERHLDFDGGFFVEAGANDGFEQSNTYYFERFRGWRGVLIEPIPELYRKCQKRRPKSRVVQAALVGSDFADREIEMQFAGLMSVSAGAFGDEARRDEHLRKAIERHVTGGAGSYTVSVPARTLSDVLDREAKGKEIDLLSLDVEGAELTALGGLDRSRHVPRYICVEAREPALILEMLASTHELVEVLTANERYQDLLLRRR